jgi:hypothetical protein
MREIIQELSNGDEGGTRHGKKFAHNRQFGGFGGLLRYDS